MAGNSPMKTDGGEKYPAAAYAYVPDSSSPSTWKLRLWESPSTKVTAKQVGMAVAALGPGFRGNKVDIPSDDLPRVKRRVLAAWHSVHTDAKPDEVPEILKGDQMTAEELTAKIGEMEGQMNELRKRAEKAEARLAVAQLPEEDQQAFASLSKEDQDKYLNSEEDVRKGLLDSAKEELQKAAGADEGGGNSDEEPTIPPEIQKRLDEQDDKLKKAEARAAAAEAVAKREQEARRVVEFTKRAETEYPNLPGEASVTGGILKALDDKLTEEERKPIHELMKSANEAFSQLSTAVGKDGSDTANSGDGWVKIEKLAKTVATERKLSFDAAVDVVCKENPELYTEYLNQQGKQ